MILHVLDFCLFSFHSYISNRQSNIQNLWVFVVTHHCQETHPNQRPTPLAIWSRRRSCLWSCRAGMCHDFQGSRRLWCLWVYFQLITKRFSLSWGPSQNSGIQHYEVLSRRPTWRYQVLSHLLYNQTYFISVILADRTCNHPSSQPYHLWICRGHCRFYNIWYFRNRCSHLADSHNQRVNR